MSVAEQPGGQVRIVHATVRDDGNANDLAREPGDGDSRRQERGGVPRRSLARDVNVCGARARELREDGPALLDAIPSVVEVVDLDLRDADAYRQLAARRGMDGLDALHEDAGAVLRRS